MKVKVMRKHIQKGKKESTNSCPIALALREKFKLPKDNVSVDEFGVTLYFDKNNKYEGDSAYYEMRRGSRFINRFDNGKPVRPCTVELALA